MCGRYTLTVSARLLGELFDLDEPPDVSPRYNIAPTQQVLVVRRCDEGRRQAARCRWGLVPSWAKDPSGGARMINARSETIASKPAFRSAVRRRRCLVAADGFYEWQAAAGRKQPYLIRFADRRPFAFAGLWERWRGPEAEPLDSCTIVTTEANPTVARVHHRMPVILSPEAYGEWLEPQVLEPTRLAELLRPHPDEGMEAFAVGLRVNSPANDDERCIAPLQ